jgi:hypothetical protein
VLLARRVAKAEAEAEDEEVPSKRVKDACPDAVDGTEKDGDAVRVALTENVALAHTLLEAQREGCAEPLG